MSEINFKTIMSRLSLSEDRQDRDEHQSMEISLSKTWSTAQPQHKVHMVDIVTPSSRALTSKKSRPRLPLYTKSDSSVYPSYSNLELPYRVICRQRYQNAIDMHQRQFIKEIRLHEKLQPFALGGSRLRREFCDPILKKVGQKDIITLTLDEERRLEYILKTDPKEL